MQVTLNGMQNNDKKLIVLLGSNHVSHVVTLSYDRKYFEFSKNIKKTKHALP
jgi:hypothetical protein